MRIITAGIAASLLLSAAGAVHAETLKFAATLTGASEVPANQETGAGGVAAMLDTDTKTLTYTATYSGLTGPATAAHFHGPAAQGSNAPPIVMVTVGASPIEGTAVLSDAQIAALKAGKVYFNIHTAAHGSGGAAWPAVARLLIFSRPAGGRLGRPRLPIATIRKG